MQFPDVHFIVHSHETISLKDSGIGARDTNNGHSWPSSILQPMDSGESSTGFGLIDCIHMMAWKCTLSTWNQSVSVVGGSASGDLLLQKSFTWAWSQLSVSATLYNLHTNASFNFVEVSTPVRRSFIRPLSVRNTFHAVLLLCPAKSETVSQPVSAWNGMSDVGVTGSFSWISCTGIYFCLSAVPAFIHNLVHVHVILLKCSNSNTNTLVSHSDTTMDWAFVCRQWRTSHVWASSWLASNYSIFNPSPDVWSSSSLQTARCHQQFICGCICNQMFRQKTCQICLVFRHG